MARNIRKGDEVIVIAGDHKDSKGKVLQVLREKNRVLVEGVNSARNMNANPRTTPKVRLSRESLPSTTRTKTGREGRLNRFRRLRLPEDITMRIPELKKLYTEEAIPRLMKSQGYANAHQVPKVEKVVLNSSFGVELDKNGIEELRKDISSLAASHQLWSRPR